MRVSSFIVGAVALLAVTAQAGELDTHKWPCSKIPQAVTTIPVLMDIQPWVRIKDLDKLVIYMMRRTANTYEGCVDVECEARTAVNVSVGFVSNGVVPGEYSCSATPAELAPPSGTVTVCVRLKTDVPPPATNVQVGAVVFRVTPKA